MFKDYKKFIFIFSLLFILLISLGAISASEYIDNQIDDTDSFVSESILSNENNVDDELMSISGNQVLENENIDDLNFKSSCEFNVLKEEGSDGNFTDLANEIAAANDELNLTKNYVYSNNDSIYKDGIGISTSDGEIILEDIQPFGKKRMDASSYLNGIDKDKIVGKVLE